MTTTKEKFAGQRAGNYCTLPTVDVPILPDHRVCETCHQLILYVEHPKGASYGNGMWVHVVDCPPGTEQHRIAPRVRCRYCHSHEAKFRQHAWHDAVECPRCGGVDGYAIGD